ncbi:hypothetical protein AHAS_Ahas04G0042300 [Arachis hypogaea]
MEKDLFWAIRGRGSSNFSVITTWKIKLVQVPSKFTIFEVSKNLDDGGSEIFTKWQTVAPKLSAEFFEGIGVVLDFMFKL